MLIENPAPITFYTADTPNGLKINIFLHEAGLIHRQINLDLSAGEQHLPEYLQINPNGKIPAIIDHDADITIFESGAILSYLSDKTGYFLPSTFSEKLRVQQWLHFQIAGIGPMLGQLWWFLHASKNNNQEAINRYRKEAQRLFNVVDRRLLESEFIGTSEFSIADIAAYPWLRTWEELKLDISSYKNVERWLRQVGNRPAVKIGIEANRASTPN